MNKKSNKIIIPILVFAAFVGGSTWTYLVINQLSRRTITSITKGGSYTINENSISGAVEKIYDATVTVATYKDGKAVSTGTGFVYKKEGSTAYIMTNNHVISGGDSAKAIFSDGTSADTKILGGETYSDIAVLTVSAASIKQIATIGNTDNIKLGDTTFAVGAPLGDTYSGTVTKGILSGKDRLVAVSFSGSTSDYYMKVLQTDAAINSGNSGGPLCNSNGEVIGITSLKLVSSGVEGMGFAIPIENAITKAEQIISGDSYEYPYLGIQMLDITDAYSLYQYYDLIKSSGLSSGVLVASIEKGSPASKAKFEKNDIITKIDGNDIKNLAYLRYYLYQHKVGDTIKVTVYRDGKTKELSVTLGTNKQTT